MSLSNTDEETAMIRIATDLTPTGKAAVETLLGRRAQDGGAGKLVGCAGWRGAKIAPDLNLHLGLLWLQLQVRMVKAVSTEWLGALLRSTVR